MSRQLFGTDGIRGVAGEYPLDRATAYAFGMALGNWARSHTQSQVLIGMDTRESGPWLAETVAAGLANAGVGARFAGLITTPGVAYLTRHEDFVAGLMISASHNPYHDNGLKVFDHSGYKLPDNEELQLEAEIFAHREDSVPTSLPLAVDETLAQRYINYLAQSCPVRLDGLRLVIDCAHGAAAHLAPALFRQLGAEVETIGCDPNGRNINQDVGALHTGQLRDYVLAHKADAGVAFDGDADRCMIISHSGKLIDGDHILLVNARAMNVPLVVATVMSNLGLERALQSEGIGMTRTPVGDKYVLEEMIRSSAPIGGEQSGHIIFRDFATTGDGLLTALRTLGVMRAAGRNLDELTAQFQVYPQLLLNVRVRERRKLDELPGLQAEIRRVEQELGDRGRVLVRFSGTEPLARIMVEGPDQVRVETYAQEIAGKLREALA